MNKKLTRREKELDFQIEFIEKVLKRCPDFFEAMMALGELYTRRGLYEKGLEMDIRLSQLRPDCPYVHYNLACSYSLLNHVEQAFFTIKQAVAYGYDHLDYLQHDVDLTNLRKDRRYQEFLSGLIRARFSIRKKNSVR